MALRFRVRHVHKTVADFIEAELTALGWKNPPVNFGTVPVTFLEFQPDEAGKPIAANTVAITLGDEGAAEDEELGGGLRELAYPLFVDVYGANQSIAASIASDVKDILEDRYFPVLDFTTDPVGVPTSEYIELDKDDLTVERPGAAASATDFRRYWRVVKSTVRVHYVHGATVLPPPPPAEPLLPGPELHPSTALYPTG